MPEWLVLFAMVPAVTGLIGWITNWSAVKMIFFPKHFVGVGKLGWQGILYRQGEKFATGMADMVRENLISAQEIAERIEPEGIESTLSKHLEPKVPELCKKLLDSLYQPGAWNAFPDHVKSVVTGQFVAQTKTIGADLVKELQGKADEFIDVHGIVYGQLSGENISRLARLTKKIGGREFTFIEIYGGVFGFLIGLFQVMLWTIMQEWWLMPVVGVLVGLVTNWLAIQMIFRPQEPTKYLGLFTYQGLFAKRQPDIAKDYGETANSEILTPAVFWSMLTEGETGQKFQSFIEGYLDKRLASEWDKYKKLIPFELDEEKRESAKGVLLEHFEPLLPAIRPDLDAYLETRLDVGELIESRMAALPKPTFERMLRSIFEEDELTLVIVGGVLGGLVGALQGLFVLSL